MVPSSPLLMRVSFHALDWQQVSGVASQLKIGATKTSISLAQQSRQQ
jgi:hypothetical protein